MKLISNEPAICSNMGKWVGWKIRKYSEGNIKQFIDEQGHVQKQSSLRSKKVKENNGWDKKEWNIKRHVIKIVKILNPNLI